MRRRALGIGKLRRRKQAGSSIYVADFKDASGRRRRKALSSDKRVAERMLADIIRQRDLVVAGLAIEEGPDRDMQELVTEYLAELEGRRSTAHYERVRNVLARVIAGMKVRAVRDIHPQAYLLYRRERLRQDITNRTANLELTILRAMINWAVAARYIGFNPLQGLKPLPAGRAYERHSRRALSDDEVERLIAASQEIDQDSRRRALATRSIASGLKNQTFLQVKRKPTVPQTPLWAALLETGARFGETVAATWADFSESSATLTLRASTTKSKRERRIPLRRILAAEIARLRLVHHEVLGRIPNASDHIFLSPRGLPWTKNRRIALNRLYAILDRAGIPRIDERGEKVDVHALRYTCASRFARHGVGLVQAQKILGHSDPKLTAAIYTQLDADDLRAAVESMPAITTATATG